MTPSVIPSPFAFSEIIESAGGVMDKTRRSLAQIQEMNSNGKINYIIVTHENDLHLLDDVIKANISAYFNQQTLNKNHFFYLIND